MVFTMQYLVHVSTYIVQMVHTIIQHLKHEEIATQNVQLATDQLTLNVDHVLTKEF